MKIRRSLPARNQPPLAKIWGVCLVLVGGTEVDRIFADVSKGITPQSISLPSGPGSVEGLGESFEPQLNSGTFVYRVPLKLPPVRQGAMPALALEYNSGAGSGPLGMGWRLNLPEIKRQTDRGLPQYDDSDTFIDWTGEELVRTADGVSRCENEGLFARFQQIDRHWIVTLRDGTRQVFGQSALARQDRGPGVTYCWKLELSEDLNGNRIAYRYTNHLNQLYPREVEYGLHATAPSATFRVVFDYTDDRPDPVVDYRSRYRVETRLRLAGVTVFYGERRIRHWRLDYTPDTDFSLLASVTMFGDDRSRLDGQATVNEDFLPSTQFGYTPSLDPQEWRFFTNRLDVAPHFATGDAELADLNRDGLPDLIYAFAGEWYAALNRGGGRPFDVSRELVNVTAGIQLRQTGTRLVDLTGDGGVTLLAQLPGETHYFFREFVTPFELGPPVDFTFDLGDFRLDDPDVQFVDANHDKAVDVMRTFEDGPALLLNEALGPAAGRRAAFYLPPDDPAMAAIQFSRGWQLADMNGDRLLDLVQFGTVDEGGTQVRLTRGLGEFEPPHAMTGGPADTVLGPRGPPAFSFVDINQDGLSDLVQVESGAVRVWLNRDGRSWSTPVVIELGVPALSEGETTVRFADVNGNGSTDIIWHQAGTTELVALDLHPAEKPNQLKRVLTGMGRGLEITYKSSVEDMLAAGDVGEPWTQAPPFPVQVVGIIEESDGLGGRYRSELTYRNGYYDGVKKEFRGFEQAVRRDLGDDSQGAPTLVTGYEFDTGAFVEVLKGRPLRVEARTETGSVFHRETNEWVGRTLPVATAPGESRVLSFAELRTVERQIFEGRPEAEGVTVLQEFAYDDYGNLLRAANYGRVEGGDRFAWNDERIEVLRFSAEFAANRSRWILDRPVATEARDGQESVFARRRLFYDDESFSGGNFGDVQRGNVTLVRDWIDPAQPEFFRATERHHYDLLGNRVLSYDPLGIPGQLEAGHAVEVEYDPVLHAHPIRERLYTANPLLRAAGEATPFLQMTAAYDLGLGVITNAIDFNDQAATFRNDTFGRLVAIVRPGDDEARPTAGFRYVLRDQEAGGGTVNWVETRLREHAGLDGTFDSRAYVDGFGRTVMTRTESELPGQVVVSDGTLFNARQQPWRKLFPYFETGTLAYSPLQPVNDFEETYYDALNRPVRVSQPATQPGGDRAVTETIYEPLARFTLDEEQTRPESPHFGAALRFVHDGLADRDDQPRLREVHEIVKLDDEGLPLTEPRAWITRYRYDPLHNFLGYTDSQNNQKEFRYDGLSQKVFMHDPDRGRLYWEYDAASNVRATVDAKGQCIEYTYDGVNRLLTEEYLDEGSPLSANHAFNPTLPLTADNRPDVAYFYDAPGASVTVGNGTSMTAQNVKGMLATVWDLTGEEHISYDSRGRVAAVIKRIKDPVHGKLVSFRTGFDYDSMDRLTRLTYPDDDEAFHEYNSRNLLSHIYGGHIIPGLGTSNVIAGMAYHPSGQISHIDYGNRVGTSYDYDPRLRLTTLLTRHTERPLEPLIHFEYDFDAASNIRRITDARPAAVVPAGDPRRNTQLFSYDDLYRLIRAQYSFETPGQSIRDDGVIHYRYDRIGNMLAQSSTIEHFDEGLPVTNLGSMESGGDLGRWNRTGRQPGDPPGPHALTQIRNDLSDTRLFPYDDNGNGLEIDGLICGWDFKDRLVRLDSNKMVAHYAYDYTDRRVTKRVEWIDPPGLPTDAITMQGRSLTSVIYVNRYAEVRPGNEAVKYIWQGDTRVARLTTPLSAGPRVQRVRCAAGWNLLSPGVTGATFEHSPDGGTQRGYVWNTELQRWDLLSLGIPLPASTVIWVDTKSSGTVTWRGTPSTRSLQTIDGPAFLVGRPFEPLPLDLLLLADVSVSIWDPATQYWRAWVPALQDTPTLFHTLSAGHALFARSALPMQAPAPPREVSVRFYHQDHLGSTTAISDGAGILGQESAHYPFGYTRFGQDSSDPYGFSQKEHEDARILVYFETRYLTSQLGRYISVDLLFNGVPSHWIPAPQSWNPYSYVRNRPTRLVDQAGMDASSPSTTAPTPQAGSTQSSTGYSQDGATRHLNENATEQSRRQCAQSVREAIEAGGVVLRKTKYARDYGNSLSEAGFVEVDTTDYVPQKGDVVVMQPVYTKRADGSVRIEGHMQMYDGEKWVSDFRQGGFWPGSDYRKIMPSFSVYRMPVAGSAPVEVQSHLVYPHTIGGSSQRYHGE